MEFLPADPLVAGQVVPQWLLIEARNGYGGLPIVLRNQVVKVLYTNKGKRWRGVRFSSVVL
jgi:hypothetical protein